LQDDRAKKVYDYREASYLKTKFATALIGEVKEDGTIVQGSVDYNGDGQSRPTFRAFGTYTGRGTYSSKVGRGKDEEPSGCAIHQWKNDPEYRKIIQPPEGYDLLEFDFAGQEFRWMAVESGDPTMLQLCMPGEDAHSFMGAKIGGRTYAWVKENKETAEGKPLRKMGKVGNLSCQYRTSPPTLMTVAAIQHKVNLTLEEARAVHANYLTSYRGVPAYWRRQIGRARACGYVETLAGRRVQLGAPDTWVYKDGGDAKWSHESTAINFPIQGIGADQKYLALMVLRNVLPHYNGRFFMELHDGLFIVVPKAKSEKAGHEIKSILSNLPNKRARGVDLPIQFPVDGKRGPSWGELKEFH
jgi:DNA polymerase-1